MTEQVEGIIKPDLDEREYRWLRLPNKLEVMLISDKNADKAAAALDVGVGHASDPADLPGLAHFLEHMLFLGTQKYPDEGHYQAFLQERGGSSNAYTDFEHTNFFFDVLYPHLHEALDIFAQFFICPLFTESMTARELNAVDSENSKNLQNDAWRLQQLHRWAASSEHPFHKFGTGNLRTLTGLPHLSLACRPPHLVADPHRLLSLRALACAPRPFRLSLNPSCISRPQIVLQASSASSSGPRRAAASRSN